MKIENLTEFEYLNSEHSYLVVVIVTITPAIPWAGTWSTHRKLRVSAVPYYTKFGPLRGRVAQNLIDFPQYHLLSSGRMSLSSVHHFLSYPIIYPFINNHDDRTHHAQ